MGAVDSSFDTRKCKKCGVIKPLTDFHRHPTCVGGRLHSCKKCSIRISVERAKNSEKDKARKSAWAKNKWLTDPAYVARAKMRGKEYFSREDVKSEQRERARRFRSANPDRVKEVRARCRARKKNDPKSILDNRIRSGLNQSLRVKVAKKTGRTYSVLGYSAAELMAHIERQFLPGMEWSNIGQWHVDHIVPLSSFKYHSTDCPEFKRAWALTNLRPLWAYDNIRKHAKRTHLL